VPEAGPPQDARPIRSENRAILVEDQDEYAQSFIIWNRLFAFVPRAHPHSTAPPSAFARRASRPADAQHRGETRRHQFRVFVLRQVAAHRQNSHATICAARVRSVQAIAQLPPAKRQMPSRSNRQNSQNLRSFHPIRFSPYSIRRKNCGRKTCFELGGALCSASSASRSQVRAMSIRMVRTRKFGACSAICRHSAACSLHSTDVIIAVPRTKTRAILTRTRCFVRSISRDASHFGAHSGVRATKFRLFQPG
jgi:hypothetical protein